MALIKFGAFVTDIRNKVGGTVFSKNAAGAYVKNKVTPLNPATARLSNVHTRMALLSQAWRGLTAAQRTSWNDAASSFPYTNQFGDTYYLSGLSLHNALNLALLNINESALTEPPTPATVEGVYTATLTAAKGTPAMSLAFTQDPVPADTAYVLYATPGISPGVSFYKGRFRYISFLDAAATSPADILADYTAKFGAVPAAGQKVAVNVVPMNKVTGQLGVGLTAEAIVSA